MWRTGHESRVVRRGTPLWYTERDNSEYTAGLLRPECITYATNYGPIYSWSRPFVGRTVLGTTDAKFAVRFSDVPSVRFHRFHPAAGPPAVTIPTSRNRPRDTNARPYGNGPASTTKQQTPRVASPQKRNHRNEKPLRLTPRIGRLRRPPHIGRARSI